jgi:hypothetical protein
MTRHQTISSLSIAVIALLAVAVPSFAQAQSNRDARSPVVTASEQSIVSNTELIAATKSPAGTPAITKAERTSVSNITRTASPLKLSASSFMVQNHYTSATSSHFVPQQTFSIAAPGDPTARKQFRADDDDVSTGTKLVTFVPSRGQKLPLY